MATDSRRSATDLAPIPALRLVCHVHHRCFSHCSIWKMPGGALTWAAGDLCSTPIPTPTTALQQYLGKAS